MIAYRPARPLLATLLLVACGDAADDGAFRGEPLDALELEVSVATALSLEGRAPRVSLVWLVDDAGGAVEVEAASVALGTTLPSRVSLALLDLPPAEVLREDPAVSGRFALGQPFVYDDADGDGAWDPKAEAVLGVATDLIVLYAPEGASGKTIGEHAPGWHHLVAAPCPEAVRLGAAQTGPGTLVVSAKPEAFFALTCAEPAPSLCAPFEETRWFCRLQPEHDFCDTCAPAVFPSGADAAACASWLEACEAAYPDDVDACRAEHAVCAAGEPACDAPCLCQHLLDICLEVADADTCQGKYAWCLGDGS